MSTRILLEAFQYAERRHRTQLREPPSGGVPYLTHPLAVATQLAHCGVADIDVLVAALLHDVLEDTLPEFTEEYIARTLVEMTKLFGERVSSLVFELTDDQRLPPVERKAQQQTYSYSADAALIKIADKTCNCRDYMSRCLAERTPALIEKAAAYVDAAVKVVAHASDSFVSPYAPSQFMVLRAFVEVADVWPEVRRKASEIRDVP